MKLAVTSLFCLLAVQVSGQATAQEYGDYGGDYGDYGDQQYGDYGDYGGDSLYQDYAEKQQKKLEGGGG